MKTFKYIQSKIVLPLAVLALTLIGCEREISDQAVLATFDSTAEIFTDNFVAMGSDFYFPYGDGFAKLDIFEVDTEVSYEGTASLRIDVPNANDPAGSYAGAFFRVDGAGRDLSGYDALTFWVKGSQFAVIEQFGFGQSETSDFQVSRPGFEIGTTWQKVTIPIPDPSKLVQERGMFWLVATPMNGGGYSMWIDELKFENLGTIGQPRPLILDGQDVTTETFVGVSTSVGGLSETFNLGDGQNVTVSISPNYFTFSTSNSGVATVDRNGQVAIAGSGSTVINGDVNGIEAQGSLTIISQGPYTTAPIPSNPAASVISIFSDNYTNEPVDFYNGFYLPYQTTTSNDFNVNGDNVLNYENFNFVGIEFNQNVPTINGKLATDFHMDVFVPGSIPSNADLRIAIVDFGPDGAFGGGDDTTIFQDFQLGNQADQWIQIDMDITGLNPKTNLGQIVLSGDGPGTPPSNFYVDNMFFYRNDGTSITPQTVELPLDFELSNPANYGFLGFEGADSAIEVNPDQTGINTSATVMRTTKTNGAQFFAGTFVDTDIPLDFSQSQTISMKVWSPKVGIPIRLAVESPSGTPQQFVDVNTTVSNQWEELTFDFTGLVDPASIYDRVVVFMEFIPGLNGDGTTYYFDDIKIAN